MTAKKRTLARRILRRLMALERQVRRLADGQTREHFTVAEAAAYLGRAEWTVRQWCNVGRCQATKRHCRGGKREWVLTAAEVERLKAEGPLPLPKHQG
jgi:hypothetical protein